MWNKLISGPLVFPLLLTSVVVSVALGLSISNKFLLPLLNVSVAYPVLFSLIAQGKRNRAYVAMLFWALCMTVVMIWSTIHYPQPAQASIFHGKAYLDEMFHWIKTGEGREGDPLGFVPQHLLHYLAFIVLSIFSGSFLSLLMGAVLMNYMSFYVGSLIRESTNPFLATIIGWPPYAILRVASFVILGIILGEPAICRIVKRDYDYAGARPFFWAALTGLALDIVIKAFLAPWWGLTLRKILP
jgi:hypothetical protein